MTILLLTTLLLLSAAAQSPAAAQLSAVTLAPTGTLRAAFLGTNPVHGRVDPQTGAVTGPVADLVKELALKLGVQYTLIAAPGASNVIEHLKNHTADIGFMAFEETRAQEVDFAGPFVLMHNSYIVRADSPIQKTADADRSGLQIGAVKGQAPELFLSGNVKNARVKAFQTQPPQAELERLMLSGEIDAFGMNRQRALDATAASSKLRALPDSFLSVEQSFVVEKGNAAKAEAINRFVDEVRASGFIKASLERAKLAGVDVAPPRRR
jgi:polar amino acid transport system substrate-binding protein